MVSVSAWRRFNPVYWGGLRLRRCIFPLLYFCCGSVAGVYQSRLCVGQDWVVSSSMRHLFTLLVDLIWSTILAWNTKNCVGSYDIIMLLNLFWCVFRIFNQYRCSVKMIKCICLHSRWEYVRISIIKDGNSLVSSKYSTILDCVILLTGRFLEPFINLVVFISSITRECAYKQKSERKLLRENYCVFFYCSETVARENRCVFVVGNYTN